MQGASIGFLLDMALHGAYRSRMALTEGWRKETRDAIWHLLHFQWHESRTQEQALREALEQIELADQLGIDEVWLGEHHFSRHGLLWACSRLLAMWQPALDVRFVSPAP